MTEEKRVIPSACRRPAADRWKAELERWRGCVARGWPLGSGGENGKWRMRGLGPFARRCAGGRWRRRRAGCAGHGG